MEKPLFKFSQAKRKRGAPREIPIPFPIPLQNCSSSYFPFHYFSGQLVGCSVHVTNEADMTAIYQMGFFGKGNLSWSGPEYNRLKKNHTDVDQDPCHLMTRRRYLTHLEWSKSANGEINQPLFERDALPYRKKTVTATVSKKVECLSDIDAHSHITESLKPRISPESEEYSGIVMDLPLEAYGMERHCGLGDDRWLKATEEDSKSYWGTASKGCYRLTTDQEQCIKPPVNSGVTENLPNNLGITLRRASDYGSQADWANLLMKQGIVNIPSAIDSTQEPLHPETTEADASDNKTVLGKTSSAKMLTDDLCLNCLADGIPVPVSCEEESLDVDDRTASDVIGNSSSGFAVRHMTVHDIVETSNDKLCLSGRKQNISLKVDQRCVENDAGGDLLVIDDSEDSDVDDDSFSQRPFWKTVQKKDPFPLTEHLQLALEEAFFLSYGLGCLIVTDLEKVELNLTQMWQRFCRLSPKFVQRYVVYHNLRSKGWVPKPGLKFGVDFVLYKHGPAFCHASYSVVVQMVQETDFETVSAASSMSSWTSLSCLNRITEQVNKELMICSVIRPTDLTDDELSSPKCIEKFKVLEVITRRWISKRERENAEFLSIP